MNQLYLGIIRSDENGRRNLPYFKFLSKSTAFLGFAAL
jgi:hypothetical protein